MKVPSRHARRRFSSRLSLGVGLVVSAMLAATFLVNIATAQRASKVDVKQTRSRVAPPIETYNQEVSAKAKAETLRSPENETSVLRVKPSKEGEEEKATVLTHIAPTALVSEIESNDTAATAQALGTTPVRVRADLFRAPFSAGVDVDFYSFTANAGDKVYAATMTGFSAGSTDTFLAIIASDQTTVLESDDEDGAIGGSASNIAGTTLASSGTYYVRVTQFSVSSLGGTIRPYDLYVRVLSGSPTPETEPNNTGTPQATAPNGWMSGVISAAADNDNYAVMANAGDTIVAIVDVDPERDTPEWNARVAIGVFNNFLLLVNGSAVGGTFDDANPSEALFMTVKTTGAYQVYVDEATGGGAAGDTYNVSISVIPGNVPTGTCTTYNGTGGAIADLATTDFTLNVPDSKIIQSLTLNMDETHGAAATADLDVSLLAPGGNEVVLFDDPPTSGTAAAPQINFRIDDEAAIPVSVFGIHSGMHYTPEIYARMAYFKGQQAQGTWTLRVRDDLTANTGTLNAWSITVCEAPPPPACSTPLTTIYTSDFEGTDGGFTHSGTQDEWERGLPTSAPITTCNSGTNCWKTDLDATYNNGANFDLISPTINLAGVVGSISLKWWQKYQMESASFDPMWVEVRQVGVPASARKVFEWKGATQTRGVGNPGVTVQMSAGWGQVEADISSFAGQNIEVRFHVETDGTGQFSGLAVDDVSVTACERAPTVSGQLVISEFRVRGPNGVNDEFIELYNTTGAALTVQAADASAGLAVAASDGTARCVVPNGTIIPAGGHYLCTNSAGYSLSSYPAGNGTATGDATYTLDIPDNAGIALFNNSTGGGSFSLANRLDAVGSTSEANTVYKEGTGYPPLAVSVADYSFYRDNCGKAGAIPGSALCTRSVPGDTNNNAVDFIFADTNGSSIGAGQRLGAPGPENLSSPIQRNATIKLSLVDLGCPDAGPVPPPSPNACAKQRDLTSDPGNNSNLGTLSIRRKVTNNTGAAVTRLRFRVVDITTFPAPVGTADLRPRTSATYTANLSGGGTTSILGLTLEQPPTQPNGGGFNSSVSAGTITLAAPLAAGASINIHFLLGVQQGGSYRYFLNVEALP